MNQSIPDDGATPLPFLGLLRVAGPDAATFLQGQLTHDTQLLADGRTLLAACNTPQGRAIALLRLRQSGEAIWALLPIDLVETVAAHLRRYVLRARAQVQAATDLQVAWIRGMTGSGPAADGAVDFTWDADRRLVVAPLSALQAGAGSSPRDEPSCLEDEWWSADIAAGLPQVFGASSAAFVPQMLNLDLLDGISFTKGCYTGQEIVARTQHLGRIKRRTFRYRLPAGPVLPPLAGLSLAGAKVAEVVMSARRGDGLELLAVTNLDARGRTLQSEDGREAVPVALPYEV